ncbi:unnamed protein product, partial [Didymodactylos carnosus]
VRCELAPTCGSVYTTFESYRSHLNRYHRDLLNDQPLPSTQHTRANNEQIDSSFLSNMDVTVEDVDEDIDRHEELYDNERETFEDPKSNTNDMDWSLFSCSINQEDDKEVFTTDSFEKHYTRFLLELREGHLLPQNIVQSITSYLTTLLMVLVKIIENQVTKTTSPIVSLEDTRKFILQITNSISNTGKNDYQFLKRCEQYFGYEPPAEIKLNAHGDCGYYIPVERSITNLLNKPDVIDNLLKNLNDTITKTKADPDLMLTYRDGSAAQTNPSLQLHPNSFLLQIYTDSKIYPMLQSIGLIGICFTIHLSLQTNPGLSVKTFSGRLHFGFSLMAADHLASNEIGGFQRNFNSGYFCRLCHVSYRFKSIPLTDISFLPRTITTHNTHVQQVLQSNNTRIITGVAGVCPLIIVAMLKEASTKRIMTYGQVEERMEIFKYGKNDQHNKPTIIRAKHLGKGHIVGSASQKLCLFKLMPIIFHDIIDRLVNTMDIYTCLREIVGHVYSTKFKKSWLPYLQSLATRFQSLMVHNLPDHVIPKVHFVTDYSRLIDMNGPATHFWCMRFEAKHLYFKQLAIRAFNFKNPPLTLIKRHQLRQCLLLSNKNYYNIYEITSRKNVKYYQLSILVQRLLNANHIDQATFDECKTIKHNHVRIMTRSVFVEKLLHVEEDPCFVYILHILNIQNTWKVIVEHLQIVGFNEQLWSYEIDFCGTLDLFDLDQCLDVLPHGLDIYYVKGSPYINILPREEVDGYMLIKLPYDELRVLLPKLKDRMRFTEERDKLINNLGGGGRGEPDKEERSDSFLDQSVDTYNAQQTTTAYKGLFDDISIPINNTVTVTSGTRSINNYRIKTDEQDDNPEASQPKMPAGYEFTTLPEQIQSIVDENDLTKLCGRTNHHRMLLSAVFKDVVNNYYLLYPKASDYVIITQALLKALKIPITNSNAMNEWREAIKQKFKNERRLLQETSAIVKIKQEKFGKGHGRPPKQSKADRLNIYVSDFNNEQDAEQQITTMKEEVESATTNIDLLNSLWKKTFSYRRLFLRTPHN